MKSILIGMAILASSQVFADASPSDKPVNDKAIFDALNVQALPIPTPYPFAGYAKQAGRLYCAHTTNTNTGAEYYTCVLQ